MCLGGGGGGGGERERMHRAAKHARKPNPGKQADDKQVFDL